PVLGHPHVTAGHGEELMVMGVSVAGALAGIFLAWVMYSWKPSLSDTLMQRMPGMHRVLLNKYYIDEFYDLIIVRPAVWLSTNVLMAITDGRIIEGIVNGVPKSIDAFGERLRRIQTGSVQHYGVVMALGLVVILAVATIWMMP
ncbi:MAG TPA: NADH-quinone oxidoreductase subunit L, partial [Nitrospirota bacterium]|nr:NADH-quinone oxidoreductase subunit L [Nitrospirota bacterium]